MLAGSRAAKRHSPAMNERDEIRKRVEAFRRMQEKLCADREARMNAMTQRTRQTLSDLYRTTSDLSGRKERE